MKLSFALVFLAALCARGATIGDVLREAAAHDATIAEARLAVEEATGERVTLRAAGLPVAVLGAAAGEIGGSRAGVPPNQPFGFGTGGIVQPLFNVSVGASRRLGDINLWIAEQKLNVALV